MTRTMPNDDGPFGAERIELRPADLAMKILMIAPRKERLIYRRFVHFGQAFAEPIDVLGVVVRGCRKNVPVRPNLRSR